MRPLAWQRTSAPATPMVSIVPSAASGSDASDGETIVRRRSRVGSVTIDHRSFPRQHSISAKVTPGSLLIVVPSIGRVTVVADGDSLTVESGHVALLGRPQDAMLVWSSGARGDILTLRRDHLQIRASRHFDEPRRLATVDKVLASDAAFSEALATLTACAASETSTAEPAVPGDEAEFHAALIALAERRTLAEELFLDVRAAREAIAYIRANHQRDCSPAALATIAGVTERTLRERFRQCLGMSIAAFVQDVRLDWAHARLVTARESRSIGELARATGFSTASAFSKSYQRRFGETPTQTRMVAVRDAGSI